MVNMKRQVRGVCESRNTLLDTAYLVIVAAFIPDVNEYHTVCGILYIT